MPKGTLRSYDEWLAAKHLAAKKDAEDRMRLLPKGLAGEILAAAAKERERLQARLAAIDEEIAKLEEILHQAKAIRTQEAGRQVKTKAAIEAGQTVRKVRRHMRQFEQERQGRLAELKEVAKVETAARAGTASALVHIVSRWQRRVDITGLQPAVKLGRRFTDSAGNPLPAEALNADGEPARLPSAAAVKAEGVGPLIVEVSS